MLISPFPSALTAGDIQLELNPSSTFYSPFYGEKKLIIYAITVKDSNRLLHLVLAVGSSSGEYDLVILV